MSHDENTGRTPRNTEVEGIIDHLVVDVAPIPRVDRPIRPPRQVTLPLLASGLRSHGRPHVASPHEFLGQSGIQRASARLGRVQERAGKRGVRFCGDDEIERREVPALLRIGEVQIESAQMSPEGEMLVFLAASWGELMLTVRGRS